MRETTIRLTVWGTSAIMGIVVLHFLAVCFMRLENWTVNYYTTKAGEVRSMLAEKWGYIPKPTALEEYTAEELAEKEALVAGLNPALIRAVMHVESRGKQFAVSNKGAAGLMQIMPANAERCGLAHWSELYQAEANVKCGVQILSEEIQTYKGDVIKALVAYNGGPNAVKKAYPESVRYAQNVIKKMSTDIR